LISIGKNVAFLGVDDGPQKAHSESQESLPFLHEGRMSAAGVRAVQRAAGVIALGPMLQGLRKPVNDLSRGALVDDIVYTSALTAIQATQTSAESAQA
jgi:hypothetical protein